MHVDLFFFEKKKGKKGEKKEKKFMLTFDILMNVSVVSEPPRSNSCQFPSNFRINPPLKPA